jgi:hypothetical protein
MIIKHNLENDCLGENYKYTVQNNHKATNTAIITYLNSHNYEDFIYYNTVAIFKIKKKC